MIDQDLINKNKFFENRVLITGQEGMIGSSIYGYLKKKRLKLLIVNVKILILQIKVR